MISLSKLAKNATQTTFYNKNRIIIQENNNFIGKLFNKPINHKYSEIIDIVAREEKIRNNSSSNNSTNINYVYKVYIVLRAHELQLISVNKGVLDLSEIEEFATTIKNIVTKS
jgi:hypothetical protein